ncbi:MAG: tetratricopeptide repeat protein [Bacteroidia bacterium]|nr:tetratricopeptide repeat protein [Bacteroidia bacterium]
MNSTINRRLAAIMFTDIAGYTAIMQGSETAASLLRQRHREVFEKDHQHYHGEILQYYGDGTLSVFKSAVEAVECAISMQQQFNTGEIVPLRIGIHLGDIVFDDSDIYGDGVNLASRIESLGVPHCILISDKLCDAVKNQSSISSQSLGYYELKNIKEPVEVFAITNKGIKVPERSELKGKIKQHKKSIAVLPFVNMSSDPENEYFSDGISEEILNALARVEGLKVTARTSSFTFKGKNMDIREIGTQLGVSHILEGSVRKSGNRVRITAQLLGSVDGYHFFSETYDRTLEDIFAVQDEIASKITNRLREHLGEAEHQEQIVKAPTLNMEAYETYLRGLYYFNQFGNPGAMSKAIPYFQKAIEMQPDFALPHARLGICYHFQAYAGKITWKEAQRNAMVHIERTRQLGVETPEAYFAVSVFEIFVQWNWINATAAIKKGLELFPNYSSLHHALSTMYYISGDGNAIVETHKKGLELDPLSIEMIFFMGIAYVWNREYEQALPYLEKVIDMVPHHRTAREYKGWIAAFQGRYDEALDIFNKLEPVGFRLHRSTCLGWVYFKSGEKEKAEACLQEMIKLESQSIGFVLDLMTLYTCFGDFDNAFLYMEKAIRNKVGDSMMIRSDPFISPLQNDPRFKKMEELVGEVPLIDSLE